jgi:TRAP-type C4-dicarboxylate transport system permease small subunit
MSSALARLSLWTSRVLLWVAAAGLVGMTGVIAWQVWVRFVLSGAAPWTEPSALLLMIGYVMLAAAAGVREGFHIRLSVAVDALPGRARALTNLGAHAVVGLFGVALAVWGVELALATWSHTIPTLGLPRGAGYLPLPVAGVLMALFALERALAELQGRELEPAWT